LAAERLKVFNAYQQFQGSAVEKQLSQASYVASFIGRKGSKALFIGLYVVKGYQAISYENFWSVPENRELQKLGMIGWAKGDHRSSALWFHLKLTDLYHEYKI